MMHTLVLHFILYLYKHKHSYRMDIFERMKYI